MGTLGHRALLQYIESNDLSGLKTFLDTRHLPVDDRDEVSAIDANQLYFSHFFRIKFKKYFQFFFFFFSHRYLEWTNCTYGCVGQRPFAFCT